MCHTYLYKDTPELVTGQPASLRWILTKFLRNGLPGMCDYRS